MKYKAIFFDLDGTAMVSSPEAMPTIQVIEAVKKAKANVKVCAATGRSLPLSRQVLRALSLKDPCVVSGGAQIIDPESEKILWQEVITVDKIRQVISLCQPYSYEIVFSDELKGQFAKDKLIKGPECIIYILNAKVEDAYYLEKMINKLDGVCAHIAGSWTKNRLDIHVTSKFATKKHALSELLKILGLDKKEVIGVGDQNNDLPLFESVGFRVAMGNATESLKAKSDYIAASVQDDGLAGVIDKFILQ